MLKNLCQLEFAINDKSYHFSCDNDAPIQGIKEALFQFQKYIGHVEDAMKIKAEEQKPVEKNEAPDGDCED